MKSRLQRSLAHTPGFDENAQVANGSDANDHSITERRGKCQTCPR